MGFSFGEMTDIPPSAWRGAAGLRGADATDFFDAAPDSGARVAADFAPAADFVDATLFLLGVDLVVAKVFKASSAVFWSPQCHCVRWCLGMAAWAAS